MKDKYTDYIVIFSVILVISLTIFWITRTSVNGNVRKIITTPINTDIHINNIQPLFKIHTNLYIKFVKLQNIKL